MKFKTLSLSLSLFALSACGFTPIYAHHDNSSLVQSHFDQIFIQTIPDEKGHFLYNTLLDRLNYKGYANSPKYELVIDQINETESDLDITKNDNSTRAQLRVNLTMVLNDRATNKTLLKKDMSGLTSYNILNSEFATRVTQKAARENVLNNLAEKIQTQLALYFRSVNIASDTNDITE